MQNNPGTRIIIATVVCGFVIAFRFLITDENLAVYFITCICNIVVIISLISLYSRGINQISVRAHDSRISSADKGRMIKSFRQKIIWIPIIGSVITVITALCCSARGNGALVRYNDVLTIIALCMVWVEPDLSCYLAKTYKY